VKITMNSSHNPTKKQKILALSSEISEQLDNLTTELDEKVKNIKILTKELLKEL